VTLQVIRLESEKEDLENKISKMEKENALLKERVTAQERDLDKIKKNSLTETQTTSLLKELVL
jgi:predicted nuclease with TOPRIM domain